MPAGYLSRSWSLCRTGNVNLLQVLTNVLSCEGVYVSAFLCSEQFLQDLIFLFCKIQQFMVAERSFHIWHEEGDGFWHHAEKLG